MTDVISTLTQANSPLNYSVQFAQFMAQKPPCRFKNAFVRGGGHADFKRAVENRIKEPHKINQLAVNLCGPNAFFYCVAKKYPNHYAKYMIDLWSNGEAFLGNLHVRPSQACLDATLNGAIAPVDWIALASLRDSSNSFFNFDEIDDATGGITYPGDMVQWFRATLFSSSENHTNIVRRANFENLRRAQQSYGANGSVCMLISSKVTSLGKKVNALPNHWVVLTSNITVDNKNILHIPASDYELFADKKINLHVATWGLENGKVPLHSYNRKRHLTLSDFMTYYYGFVVAKK
ncbi:hypothetical protein [Pseudoalteromonas ruthenica]|uniref:hypothetical protein n=1 Tax=Pseudoalteromonas ruthenica TaxID=151081 RepID=UPI0012442AAD|nr:hypothetical protein [Pseudoalteromonas ruthenica]